VVEAAVVDNAVGGALAIGDRRDLGLRDADPGLGVRRLGVNGKMGAGPEDQDKQNKSPGNGEG
jgi:hypothetical protein